MCRLTISTSTSALDPVDLETAARAGRSAMSSRERETRHAISLVLNSLLV
jgi:hypothetical protein